jgi:hypothetical protein
VRAILGVILSRMGEARSIEIGAACLALAACASDPAPIATATLASPCVLEQRPVALADGREVYIEPQTLLRVGDEWLVVGSPSYEFAVAPGREAVNLSRRQHVGAWLARPARTLGKPTDGMVGSMLSTTLANGRWAAIFDEIEPPPDSSRSLVSSAYPVSYWYGEHDGIRWTLVEPLATPAGSKLDLRRSANLVRAGDRLVWIGYDDFRRYQPLVWYERIDGVWRHERLPDELVELAVLDVDEASGLWFLFSGDDPALPGWQKSLRLYREGPPRELVSRVVAVAGDEGMIYYPDLEIGRDGITVSWAVNGPGGMPAFTRTRLRPGSESDSIVQLDDDVEYVHSLTMPDGSLAWLVEHHVDRDAQREELRLLRLDGANVVRTATVPSPFTGFLKVAPAGPNEVLLVGPQMGRVATETPVRSLILRLSTSC